MTVSLRYGLRQKSISAENFNKIEEVIKSLYPKIPLYQSFGNTLQKYEGDILLDVMYHCMNEGTITLPVHDAIACQERHKNEVKELILHYWKKI